VSKFKSSERRTIVEEKDLHLEPEEDKDVEGHMDLGTDVGKVDAGHADDDDDVEGHVDLNRVDAANVDAGNVDI
jgi:hypothetical protein